jgi:D-tagatose-1,6-bisphosphate aldolase subunit GatZ/KbaZ
MIDGLESTILDEILQAHKRGRARGITSICSAHPQVLAVATRHAIRSDAPLLVESTCNQVNQYGGYTGMTPAGFMAFLREIAAREGLEPGRLLVGGDHLGPGPWQDDPAGAAMAKACRLVADCVLAGYTKLHLDASMRLGDDPPDRPLDTDVSARRSAELARAAEQAAQRISSGNEGLRYVFGSEVPPPGGIQAGKQQVAVTPVESAAETVELTRQAFTKLGLGKAWERVMALVVEAGAEYGEQGVYAYDSKRAASLAGWIEGQEIVFEAHSTDYQVPQALRRMVEDHFAVLKVGPALTFAFREAAFALEAIEAELLEEGERSGLRRALEQAMLSNPAHWEKYASGDETQRRLARLYGLSDRARYYWPHPGVQAALGKLLNNLEGRELPLGLLSQHLPEQAKRVLSRELEAEPQALIAARVEAVLEGYTYACRGKGGKERGYPRMDTN